MIEKGYRVGLFAEIAAIQAKYYGQEWGFKLDFERERMRDLVEFSTRFNEKQDLILRIEGESRLLGSLVIDGSDPALLPQQAHLSWVILDKSLQGKGQGTKMMQLALKFLQENYQSCYLDTFQGLNAARKLYENFGFVEVPNDIEHIWQADIQKQKFLWINQS